MKQCAYCGRENIDDAACCKECGTAEFVAPRAGAPSAVEKGLAPATASVLVRGRPKLVIVLGMCVVLPMFLGKVFGGLMLGLSLVPGPGRILANLLGLAFLGLCACLMYRASKNFNIQKQRAAAEAIGREREQEHHPVEGSANAPPLGRTPAPC